MGKMVEFGIRRNVVSGGKRSFVPYMNRIPEFPEFIMVYHLWEGKARWFGVARPDRGMDGIVCDMYLPVDMARYPAQFECSDAETFLLESDVRLMLSAIVQQAFIDEGMEPRFATDATTELVEKFSYEVARQVVESRPGPRLVK